MGFLRRYNVGNGETMIKINHRNKNYNFKKIGQILKINDKLNIVKILFEDKDGKIKKYWFHLFTGSVVTLPKKGEKWAVDVNKESDKAYYLSTEPIYPYDIDPKLDINYKIKKAAEEERAFRKQREEEEERNKKESIIRRRMKKLE